MKKICILLILSALLLTACGNGTLSKEAFTLTVDNQGESVTLTVDPSQQTIADGANLYRYAIEEDVITILYPNGSSFSRNDLDGYHFLHGDAAISSEYLDGELLTQVLSNRIPPKNPMTAVNVKNLIAGILVILLGVTEIRRPDLGWKLRHGFVYDAPEFSDFTLTVSRIVGGITIFGGSILAISGFVQ
jgi:hypothetical protein